MKRREPSPDVFDPDGLEALLLRAEHDPAASAELDLLADVVAAAELERGRLGAAPVGSDSGPAYLLRPWILAAAASVLFLLALGLWLARQPGSRDPSALALREAPRYVATELRTPGEPGDSCFPSAMESYARGDWPAAAAALEDCLAWSPEHAPTHFYLAAACEQLGDDERALRHYQRAASAPDALLADHARLRLGRLWIARGEVGRGRAELEAVREGGGELAPNARALLEDLRHR